jgi:phosphoesterase RecJ-like protein
MSLSWDKLVSRLNSHQRFILTSHIRPDCDALGSELGMAGILQGMGKEVTIVNGHPTPPILTFLDPKQSIRVLGESIAARGGLRGLFDHPRYQRTVAARSDGRRVCVVLAVTRWSLTIMWEKTTSERSGSRIQAPEATGHLVARCAQHAGVPISKAMAGALYAAIATDTGWFRFASTTRRRIA